jgi:hypothetical protein
VRRLDDHQQPADGRPELAGHVVLQAGELDQVAVPLGPEVDAVRVRDQFDRPTGQPEVQQADARDIRRVGMRLEGRDRRRARGRVPAQPVHDPGHLVPPGVLVVEQPPRVAVRPAQGRDLRVVGEVGVHPSEPAGLGVPGDDLVIRVGPRHDQRDERDLADRQAVVPGLDAVTQDHPGHLEPGGADGRGGQDARFVARQRCRHYRIVCTGRLGLA